MCGRYALGIRAAFVRHQLQNDNMPVDEAPEDDDVRETYNFAPGYYGLVYRADLPDYGAGPRPHDRGEGQDGNDDIAEKSPATEGSEETRYKLQAMKWGLVPFWTKRNPDYGSVMKTINARDDSLIENRGMWNTMKQRKRCIVVAQGFYEWLKKSGGKEKIPYFTKRKDAKLMYFAGLWDCVRYESSEEKHYTYTIITTDSNRQLKFLHDRMPVILDGSKQVRTWLDPGRWEWSKELQSLLKPYLGELECYAVSKEVGKVGNNSPAFIIPVASAENKSNIANFFSNSQSPIKKGHEEVAVKKEEIKVEKDEEEKRQTVEKSRTEDNAPMPGPEAESPTQPLGLKRERSEDEDNLEFPVKKSSKGPSRAKTPEKSSRRKTRSATSNKTMRKGSTTTASDGSQRITNFFNK